MAYRTNEEKKIGRLQPPQSLDAEQAVLGAILKDEDAINRTIEVIDNESVFYSPANRFIYRAILDLYEKSEPCDITTVANHLVQQDKLEKAGGRVYLVELAEMVASTANVTSYANIVLEKSLLRKLINSSNEIIQSCYNMDEPVDNLLDHAEATIFSISESRMRKGFIGMKELVDSSLQEIDDMQISEGGLSGLHTGFRKLDEKTLGLHPGDLVIVAGRPSMGKTSLAMNIAENVATREKDPKGVGIFSIEMSKEQLVFRMLCGRGRLNQQDVRSGKLRDSEWPELNKAGNVLRNAPIFVDDSPTLTSLEVRAKARRLKAQHDIGLIIVDYIQMMYGTARSENRQQEIAVISRGMKALAKELEVPVIAISQLSRQVEQRGQDKRPQLSDLRESGAIEQDADLVIFVYRPEFYMAHVEKTDPAFLEVEGKAEIIIAKQRNGPIGIVNLAFVKEFARFENLAEQHHHLPPGVDPVQDHPPDMPF
ncbi:MAG: replicative DNA helicase [bacterium]|nr:replicative DNA helicase [bacterium]